MRKLLLLCTCVFGLAGCAPTGDPSLRDRDERNFPDPALGVKNAESETYSTQQLASPSATPVAAAQSAPVGQKPIPAQGNPTTHAANPQAAPPTTAPTIAGPTN